MKLQNLLQGNFPKFGGGKSIGKRRRLFASFDRRAETRKNKAAILRLANNLDLGRVHFVEEKIYGKISWRKRKVAEILDELTIDDALIVSELSRLGRSMLECMEILSVALEKGVKIYAIKGNWSLDHGDFRPNPRKVSIRSFSLSE